MIKVKSQYKPRSIANNVEIIVPVPNDVDSPSFKSEIGSVQCVSTLLIARRAQLLPPQTGSLPLGKARLSAMRGTRRRYMPDKDCAVWSIKQLYGKREYKMKAHFGLPSVSHEDSQFIKAPIKVRFEIPYFTVSGIQVRYLKIIEKSGYQALPWVRYITQNGDYQLRTT